MLFGMCSWKNSQEDIVHLLLLHVYKLANFDAVVLLQLMQEISVAQFALLIVTCS